MATCEVELIDESDVVAMAQCMAIDADAFPYPSARFGMRAARSWVWVARRGGAVEGFLAAAQARPGGGPFVVRQLVGSLHIQGLAVALGARRRGLGRALVRTAVAYAMEANLDAVELHVWVGNAGAIALYESEGFAVASRLRDFYPAAAFGPRRDALAMTRSTR